jgi:hypothetical protein
MRNKTYDSGNKTMVVGTKKLWLSEQNLNFWEQTYVCENKITMFVGTKT